ncbi:hypothetical protein ACHAW5_010183 [Stephanodiscus triporus]|uniref:serine O-acetyltransferase n=1 Tax=Stephanodiscus triporus TaxID=2934178 RepID=A0ABD3PN08_9STRA
MFLRLRREASSVARDEPILAMLLSKVGLLDDDDDDDDDDDGPSSSRRANDRDRRLPAISFEEAISRIVSHRLSSCSGKTESICPNFLRRLIAGSFESADLEMGHTMAEAVREDAMAILRRDPACETLLEAVLFMKGFHSLVIHRAARRAWRPAATGIASRAVVDGSTIDGDGDDDDDGKRGISSEASESGADKNTADGGGGGGGNDHPAPVERRRFVALLLQSLASSAFGVDIHPASSIGAGIMIDHATGVVIGETATVGDGTTILHGVTLGGTGKEGGDRHPKIGKHVLIGAGTQILGNITVGDRAKIGAGSVVLRPIPSGATAVGSPARIIGFTARGERPGSTVDLNLEGVEPLRGDKRKSFREVTKNLVHVSRLMKRETMTESGKSGTTVDTNEEMDNSRGTKSSDETNVGLVVDSEEYTSKEDEKDGGSGEEEEDDNVTDFGTVPKCRWVRASSGNDSLCPFSGSFSVIPSSIKKKCISHKQLRDLLVQEGCSEGECVEVYFALLHRTPTSSDFRQYGCIPLEIFSGCFPVIAREKTRLDADRVQALAEGDLRALGMSKKASRRFKSILNRLGASTVPRITSSRSMSLDKKKLSNSERERMGNFLDKSAFQEGISI